MPNSPNSKVLGKLDEVDDWPALIEKMVAYAVKLAIREYRWKRGTLLPKGNDILDIVHTVVKKLYSGERTWDPDEVPLEIWIRGNIRSEMSNLFSSAFTQAKKVREQPLEADNGTISIRDDEIQALDGEVFSHTSPNPEDVVIERENASRMKLTLEALYEAIDGDELLEKIYFEIIEGSERTPRILAEKLGTSRQDIYNALRRLDRHVETVLREKGGEDE